MKCFNAFTGETTYMPVYSPTLQSLRNPSKYWVISDAQLKRDLKGRSIKDVYRDNHAGRIRDMAISDKGAVMGVYYSAPFGKYEPRQEDAKDSLRNEYLAECAARGHTPHLASIDSDHPLNCHREKAPKRELQLASEHPDHIFQKAA
jgi:hypothetical protein